MRMIDGHSFFLMQHLVIVTVSVFIYTALGVCVFSNSHWLYFVNSMLSKVFKVLLTHVYS